MHSFIIFGAHHFFFPFGLSRPHLLLPVPMVTHLELTETNAYRFYRELSLPPLSTLSINRTPVHSPPAAAYQAADNTYFPQQAQQHQHQLQQQMPHQMQHQIPQQHQHQPPVMAAAPEPPVEAPIQSWAGSTVSPQQPRPVAPMQGTWAPGMAIKFAGPSGSPARGNTPGGKPPVGGTWDPNSGIKFG